MSDENKGAAAPEAQAPAQAPQEEIKNLKAEFNRKLSNLEQSNAQLLAQLQAIAPKPQAAPDKKVSVFEDEEAYAQRIIAEAETRAEKKLRERDEALAKQQATVSALVQDFPELSHGDHDLTKKAVELYNALPDEEKRSPLAYRTAVKEAALELGIQPKNKRKADADESFALSGGSSGTKKKAADAEGELDPRTVAFAEQMGLKLTKEVKERMAKKHGRKSYTSWS